MVPDHRRGVEPQSPAALPEPPAHIDVVAGDAEPRSKPPTASSALSEGHVATWYVLRLLIGEEDVDWIARRVGDTLAISPSPGGAMFGPPTPACPYQGT